MRSAPHATLLPLVLLVSGTDSRCRFSTDSGTGELHISGTVHFLRVEGGCWQLEGVDGRRYELQPGRVPSSLLRDRARVRVVGHPVEQSTTGCQVGTPLEVLRVVSME